MKNLLALLAGQARFAGCFGLCGPLAVDRQLYGEDSPLIIPILDRAEMRVHDPATRYQTDAMTFAFGRESFLKHEIAGRGQVFR